MKFFIDSGNLKDYEALVPLGIIDGATTNPSLMAKEGGDPRAIIKKICGLVKGPVSAEVVATDAEGMIAEGRDLATIDEHVVVKVPFTRDGVKACKTLAGEGLRVNVTLDLLADAGADGGEGRRGVRQPVRRPARRHRVGRHAPDSGDRRRSSSNYEFATEILVASVRSPMHIVQAAMMGADVCTCPGGGHRRVLQSSAHRHRARRSS